MPADDGKLPCNSNRRNLLPTVCSDTEKEGPQWTRHLRRRPCRFNQHRAGMRTSVLANTTMLSKAESGLPNPGIKTHIADKLLRLVKAVDVADCCYEPGSNRQINARYGQQSLDRRFVNCGLGDLAIENIKVFA